MNRIHNVHLDQRDQAQRGAQMAGLGTKSDEVVEAIAAHVEVSIVDDETAMVHFCRTAGSWEIEGPPREAATKVLSMTFDVHPDIVPTPDNTKEWYIRCTITVKNMTAHVHVTEFSEMPLTVHHYSLEKADESTPNEEHSSAPLPPKPSTPVAIEAREASQAPVCV